MKKKIFILVLFVYFISLSSSLDFGISPEEILISSRINKESCENFTLIGGESLIFSGETKWSKLKSRDIRQYSINGEDLGIKVSYPPTAASGTYYLCITPTEGGKYYGAIMYKIEGTNYGIGTWIELDVESESVAERISLISGNAIAANKKYRFDLTLVAILLTIILFLAIRITFVVPKNKHP